MKEGKKKHNLPLRTQTSLLLIKANIPRQVRDIWVVRLTKRLDSDEWKSVNTAMQTLGGVGGVVIKGGILKEDPPPTN